ncbi:DUF4270 domain-containing protein [Flavobacterium rhizosphaerae]|uniref:DUF4270 domain-containing protein n=1 Tax=Flavobacterium rhizosphaerae TaxID=3163298 RepID=A0ABW8YXY4_9FLAO
MINCSFVKKLLFLLSVIILASCDTDYKGLGANIVGTDLHNGLVKYDVPVVAYDRPTGDAQTNSLLLNSLGTYNSPVFGTTKAHYVTQLQLQIENPAIGNNPVVDSVWIYLPYYSKLQEVGDDGVSTYSLDSVYGDATAKFKLSIRRNGYFLREADPSSGGTETQRYFSGQKDLFDSYAGESILAEGVPSIDFGFDASEVTRTAQYTDDEGNLQSADAEVLAPGMFQYLNKDFFQQWILEAPAGKLASNNVFKDYLRGIYFEAEQIGTNSIMGMPRFSEGYITIIYKQDDLDSDGNQQTDDTGAVLRESRSITLKLGPVGVNLFENDFNSNYADAINTSDPVSGDDKLYIKGGNGSMAFIDLNQAGLDALKAENIGQKVLINEANLSFFIDKETMAGAKEPFRVYLYDVNNERPLYDYYVDVTTSTTFPKYSRYIHGGIIEVDSDKKGVRYKIRVTDHVNNIINKDSTNVKLGLVVTESINITGNSRLKNVFTETDATGNPVEVEVVPAASVMHPFGTVLYGGGTAVPEDKRIKLEIFYTKPE